MQSWNCQAYRDREEKRVSEREVWYIPESRTITLAGTSSQGYQVVSCFQRDTGRRKKTGPRSPAAGT